jgi:hypothetical protein
MYSACNRNEYEKQVIELVSDLPNFSSSIMILGLAQPVTEISTINYSVDQSKAGA